VLAPEDEGTRVLRNVGNYLTKGTALLSKLRSSNEKAPEKDGVSIGHIAYGRDEKFCQNFLGGGGGAANVSVGVMLRFTLKFGYDRGGCDFKEADIITFSSSSVNLPRRICPIRLVSGHLT